MNGGNLHQFITDRDTTKLFTEKQLAKMMYQISSAIHYLHNTLRVAHRDIKANNILLERKDFDFKC